MKIPGILLLITAALGSTLPQLVLNPNASAAGDVSTAIFNDPNLFNKVYVSNAQQWTGHIDVRDGRRLFFWCDW